MKISIVLVKKKYYESFIFAINGKKTHTLIIDEKLILADLCLLVFPHDKFVKILLYTKLQLILACKGLCAQL